MGFYWFRRFVSVGKLPASVVSEEKLEVFRRYEQAKIDKLLSDFVTYCGKVWFPPPPLHIFSLVASRDSGSYLLYTPKIFQNFPFVHITGKGRDIQSREN